MARARFCTRCGKELAEGEVCDCSKISIFSTLKSLFSNGIPTTSENSKFLERGKKIVPDSVHPDDSEIPIRQYRFARLRSRFRGQYAEGRLQITNKRLLFRATGISTLGKTIDQQEFAIDEIAGVEIKKSNRVSLMNVFICVFLSALIFSETEMIFDAMLVKVEFLASFLSMILAFACCFLFVASKNSYWLKLCAFSVGLGALIGTTGAPISPLDIVFGFELFTLTNLLIFILSIAWLYVLLRVCFVPDLIFSVKTKSASDVVQIRRRVWGMFFKQHQEYTGFSEVLPWYDTDKVSEELGAIINDLQTTGDMAIEIWKED